VPGLRLADISGTVNIMESDEFLHLLSEEESSEDRLKALHHCLEKLPEE